MTHEQPGIEPQPKPTSFSAGRICATPGALAVLDEAKVSGFTLLARHKRCDWGGLCEADREQNDLAILEGSRLLSSHRLPTGRTV